MSDLTRLWHYSRPKLAASLADRVGAHERIAMFGPRQTGKTTLLRDEVLPKLEKAGILGVYIECWADRGNPLASINYALDKALSSVVVPSGTVRKLARTPIKKVGALGASVEFGDDARRPPAATPYLQFDNLLVQLLEASGKDVALVFDEFQVVAEVADGDNIGAAIRAALTQVSDRVGAIFSGSSDTALVRMFSESRTPLFGFAATEAYKLLDVDFIGHVAKHFNLATKRDLSQVEAQRVFQVLGHQPEPFLHAVSLTMSDPKWSLERGLNEMLSPQAKNKWTLGWYGLTPIQQAALRLVYDGVAPTGAAGLRWAATATGQAKIQGSTIAKALDALSAAHLISRNPTGRGYGVSDPVMGAWLSLNKHPSAAV